MKNLLPLSILVGSIVVGVVCWGAPALGQTEPTAEEVTYALDGAILRVVGGDPDGLTSEIGLPCIGQALASESDRLYVACGSAGILVLGLDDPSAPRVLQLRHVGGEVTGFFQAQGRTWAEIVRLEARPVGSLEALSERDWAGPPTAVRIDVAGTGGEDSAETPADLLETVVEGTIIEVESGRVVIDLGSDLGVSRGDHIELFIVEDVALGLDATARSETRISVGEVTAVNAERAEVSLGMNERVPSQAIVRPTNVELTGTPWLPPRLSDLWHIAFAVRPFLSLGTLGLGTVSDLEVAYAFDAPVAIHALVEPLGLGLADDGNIVAAAVNLIVSYDTDAFEIGLGLGWSAINDEFSSFGSSDEASADGIDLEFDQVSSGLSVAQYARLGSRDGFHLRAVNSFILNDDQFEYGGTNGAVQVPFGRDNPGMWFITRGGGGLSGYAFGEIGLRVLVSGNGDRGSVFLTPTIGGANLSGQVDVDCEVYDSETGGTRPGTCTDDIDYGGPMVGFGVEWRL